MGNEVYQVGVARVDITPPVGIRLTGYTVREGLSTSVLEPLTATALYVSGQTGAVCLVAVDITMYPVEELDRLREKCGEALGIPASNVLLNWNHTHAAPAVGRFWYPTDTPEQLAVQDAFERQMWAGIEKACVAAAANAQPSRMAAGWGECAANINRRQKTDNGDMLMGEDPNGPSDQSVGVLRFDDLTGKAIAIAFRYSCHTVTLGPKTNVISPDFIGPARQLVEREMDCVSLFFQGCAGNQNPITGIGQDDVNFEDTYRIGRMVGAEVVRTASTLRTQRRRKAPRLVQSVAVYWMYEYEEIAVGPQGIVAARENWMELPLEPFDSIDVVKAERDEWAGKLEDATRQGVGEAAMAVAVRFAAWSERRLQRALTGPNPATVRFPVQTVRIGDVAIIGIPFEPMSETGTDLRDQSPAADTWVMGYCNGMVSYLPTPKVSAEGGMEARLGYKAYMVPSAIPGHWEAAIRDQCLAMVNQQR